uniref:F-box domain-containing protein n=1 Tax=Picea sitchensis TaxID=3332 RepID=A9NZ52_PICSI|nr:unknown [Picea sitchensis]
MGQEGIRTTESNEWVNRMCASNSLHDLPDDVLALVSESLQPRDLCNMRILQKAFPGKLTGMLLQ